LGDCFVADRGCGSCFGLGCSNLLQSYRELGLLGSMDLLPQKFGLRIEKLVQGG
jgi:hypothetical protein